MHVQMPPSRAFQPFEYMAWAKSVPGGARYPLHRSGLAAPHPSFAPALPACVSLLETRALVEDTAARLTSYLGAPELAVTFAAGASEALFAGLAPFIAPGQAVVVDQPAYRAIERVVQFLGGVPVHWERREAERWLPDPEHLERLLADRGARVVAITDPHNPTGACLDHDRRRAVIEVVERRGAMLLVDEIFAPFRGPERPSAWAAASPAVLSVGSLTKGWGLSALRAGWVTGDPALVARCASLFDLLGVNPPAATLALATAALERAAELDGYARAAAERARAAFAGTDWGAASLMVEGEGIIRFLRLPAGLASEDAAALLREQDGVQTVPGHFFGDDGYLRLGIAEDVDGESACRLVADRLVAG